jgi:hypothetical protein
VPAGKTLKIGGNVTVTGGTIDGEGALVGLPNTSGATATAPGLTAYSLDSTENYNPTGLTVVSASKDLKTGAVTVALGGTVSGGITDWQTNNMWGQPGANKPSSGNWSGLVFNGIPRAGLTSYSTIAIKQTNQSLRYYTGHENQSMFAATKPTAAVTGGADVWLDADNGYKDVFKWKQYAENTFTDKSDNSFSVLLWSGASPKTATLEITSGTEDDAYTVIVDWNGLTINS